MIAKLLLTGKCETLHFLSVAVLTISSTENSKTDTLANSKDPDKMPKYATFYQCLYILLRNFILAHRIRISEILPWDRKAYPTQAILPKTSSNVLM